MDLSFVIDGQKVHSQVMSRSNRAIVAYRRRYHISRSFCRKQEEVARNSAFLTPGNPEVNHPLIDIFSSYPPAHLQDPADKSELSCFWQFLCISAKKYQGFRQGPGSPRASTIRQMGIHRLSSLLCNDEAKTGVSQRETHFVEGFLSVNQTIHKRKCIRAFINSQQGSVSTY